jgi:BirA family biotin operon repressor/biotin-[acetyl-CoA-carboxylase] ligase
LSSPFNVEKFREALRTKTLGRNFVFEPVVGSTMDVARDAATHGAVDGTVVATDEQTSGRGRLGRSWVNPPAVNLASTMILRAPRTVVRWIAMMTPLSIVRAVDEVTGLRADIKWPNDVQIAGKKLAGILIETDFSNEDEPLVLVGVGINVNFDPREHADIRDIATSLREETGHEVEREALLAACMLQFEGLYESAKSGVSPFDAWRELLVTLGQHVHASWPGGEARGLAEGVDEDGALLVRIAEDAVVRVEAGDVTLRPQ